MAATRRTTPAQHRDRHELHRDAAVELLNASVGRESSADSAQRLARAQVHATLALAAATAASLR